MWGSSPVTLRRLFTLVRGVMTDVMPVAALPGSEVAHPVVRPIREAPRFSSPSQVGAFFGRGG